LLKQPRAEEPPSGGKTIYRVEYDVDEGEDKPVVAVPAKREIEEVEGAATDGGGAAGGGEVKKRKKPSRL
jgi:hypothetical protein